MQNPPYCNLEKFWQLRVITVQRWAASTLPSLEGVVVSTLAAAAAWDA